MGMKTKVCSFCHTEAAHGPCGHCRAPLCRTCAQNLEPETFSLDPQLQLDFPPTFYCAPCMNETVAPKEAQYNETLERAKKVYIFHLGNPHPRSLVKLGQRPLSTTGSRDRDETYLRLGYQAAQKGFNAVVEVEVARGRPRNIWTGTGMPAHIDAQKQARFED